MAATRVEHRLQFFYHERDFAAAAEHGRDHARQRHRPGIVLGILGIDEHLERTGAALVVDDVVQGDVDGMVAFRPAQLVGLAIQVLGPVQRFEQPGHRPGVAQVLGHDGGHRFFQRQFRFRRAVGGVPVLELQHRAGDVVGPVRGATLAAQVEGLGVDVLEAVEGNACRAGDGV